jgi:hypothetical protein
MLKSLVLGYKTKRNDAYAIQQAGFLDKFNISGLLQIFRVKGSCSTNKHVTKAKVAHQRFQ